VCYEQSLIVSRKAKSVTPGCPWYVSCSAYAPVEHVAVGQEVVVLLSLSGGRCRGGEGIER
jgi:hypothetical protein